MWKGAFFYLGLPLSIAAAILAVRASGLTSLLPLRVKARPQCQYPPQFDLGEREQGDQIIMEFAMRNTGDATLVVDDIRSSCACTVLEEGGTRGPQQVASLQIGPGESKALQLQLLINGVSGTPLTHVLNFHTNDPERPRGQIAARVSRVRGGVFTTPSSVLLGKLSVGETIKAMVTVWDDGIEASDVTAMESSNPQLVGVHARPSDGAGSPNAGNTPYRRIYVFDLACTARAVGDINEAVTLRFSGQKKSQLTVPVSGRVVGAVEASPAKLVLPRIGGDGPIYTANCLLRSAKGERLTMVGSTAPPGISVDAAQGGPAETVVLRIAVDPVAGAALAGTTSEVRVALGIGGGEASVAIPVTYRPEGGK